MACEEASEEMIHWRKRNPKKMYPHIKVHFSRKKSCLGGIITRIEILIQNCPYAIDNLIFVKNYIIFAFIVVNITT